MGLGIPADPSQAIVWFQKAAEAGNAAAQNNLGYCYKHGHGVGADLVAAVTWYRKSAQQGDVNAQVWLGYCYDTGTGVLKDQVEAYAYYNLASITNELAQTNRSIIEKTMTQSQIEAGQKRSKELQKEIETKKGQTSKNQII